MMTKRKPPQGGAMRWLWVWTRAIDQIVLRLYQQTSHGSNALLPPSTTKADKTLTFFTHPCKTSFQRKGNTPSYSRLPDEQGGLVRAFTDLGGSWSNALRWSTQPKNSQAAAVRLEEGSYHVPTGSTFAAE
jgi:hypothetical protein